ncbi:hypothetical protein SAMN05880582_101198 [Rhizobium sp. RU20A]|nr:hypothetical protein SAMN05880582_101198 [Rhizobium sp. RU20A]
MEMQTYLPADLYGHVIDLIEDLFDTFDPAAPDCLKTRLAMILGEEGGIWPAYCYRGEDEGVKKSA